mmetsp:Transcript_2961/g.7668  ORF Transcript_2961/g.7668 Transcript_2961/m.7668 type:complete len:211 (-) Transcript_2961:547-1179(-)
MSRLSPQSMSRARCGMQRGSPFGRRPTTKSASPTPWPTPPTPSSGASARRATSHGTRRAATTTGTTSPLSCGVMWIASITSILAPCPTPAPTSSPLPTSPSPRITSSAWSTPVPTPPATTRYTFRLQTTTTSTTCPPTPWLRCISTFLSPTILQTQRHDACSPPLLCGKWLTRCLSSLRSSPLPTSATARSSPPSPSSRPSRDPKSCSPH